MRATLLFNKQLQLQLSGLYDPIEKVRFYLYFFVENPVYTELLLMELRVNKNFLHSDYYQSVRDATAYIFAVIKEGQEQGRIRVDVSSFIIRTMILGPLEYATTHWLIMGKKIN